MTDTPDELERAVDRLLAAPIGTNALSYDFLLSERAELLATVERMREIINTLLETSKADCPAGVTARRDARAVLTTGEDK